MVHLAIVQKNSVFPLGSQWSSGTKMSRKGKVSNKFEVSTFTYYEDTKGSAKCRKCGGFWRLGTQGHQQPNYSIERI